VGDRPHSKKYMWATLTDGKKTSGLASSAMNRAKGGAKRAPRGRSLKAAPSTIKKQKTGQVPLGRG